jgi:hypothetical protein
MPLIWGSDQRVRLRQINTTGKSGASPKIVSNEEQLLDRSLFRGASPSTKTPPRRTIKC